MRLQLLLLLLPHSDCSSCCFPSISGGVDGGGDEHVDDVLEGENVAGQEVSLDDDVDRLL